MLTKRQQQGTKRSLCIFPAKAGDTETFKSNLTVGNNHYCCALTFGSDSNTSAGSNPPGPNLACLSFSNSYKWKEVKLSQIYTTETRPALSLSRHGAQFGGLRVFPIIKIIVVRQVCKLPTWTAVWAWRQSGVKSRTPRDDRERICYVFAFARVVGKKPKTPKVLPTPLHGAV